MHLGTWTNVSGWDAVSNCPPSRSSWADFESQSSSKAPITSMSPFVHMPIWSFGFDCSGDQVVVGLPPSQQCKSSLLGWRLYLLHMYTHCEWHTARHWTEWIKCCCCCCCFGLRLGSLHIIYYNKCMCVFGSVNKTHGAHWDLGYNLLYRPSK